MGVYNRLGTMLYADSVISYYFTEKLKVQENGTYLNTLTHIFRHSSKVCLSKVGQNVIP